MLNCSSRVLEPSNKTHPYAECLKYSKETTHKIPQTLVEFTGVQLVPSQYLAMVQNQWYHCGIGAPPILEPILVGILGVRGFDPWPFRATRLTWQLLMKKRPHRRQREHLQPTENNFLHLRIRPLEKKKTHISSSDTNPFKANREKILTTWKTNNLVLTHGPEMGGPFMLLPFA